MVKPTTTIRIDQKVKERATEVFDEIGISMSASPKKMPECNT